jgi:hypothetical protein
MGLPPTLISPVRAEEQLVLHFEDTYLGRVPLTAGVERRSGAFVRVYPLVVTDGDGRALGIIAIAPNEGFVQLYRIGAFVQGRGDGASMMTILCAAADRFGAEIRVQVEPEFLGTQREIPDEKLREWYRRFGFVGGRYMTRRPVKSEAPTPKA